MTVLFNPDIHQYSTEDGKTIPSVTQILSGVGLIDTTGFSEERAEFGRHVHSECEMWDLYGTDEVEADSPLRPYLDAWKKFRLETGFTPTLIEWAGSSKYGYAGMLDRLGYTHLLENILLDIKSGPVRPWHALQLAGYQFICQEAGHKVFERWSIHLKNNGTYSLERHKELSDHSNFLACVSVYHLKERMNPCKF